MKRLSLLVVMALMATMVQGQSNVVASAYSYLTTGMPDKAAVEIDKAIIHEATMNEAKTWFYRGNVYLQLYTFAHQTDGIVEGVTTEDLIKRIGEPESRRTYKKLENGEKWYYPNDLIIFISNEKVASYEFPGEATYKSLDDGQLLQKAFDSYLKTMELDIAYYKRELNPPNAEIALDRVAKLLYNDGVEKFQAKKTQEALISFEFANKVFSTIGTSDDNLLLYTGFAAESLLDTAKAIKYYTKLAAKKSDNPNLYMSLSYLYIGQNKTKEALEVIKVGRTILPNNQNLLLTEANIYLQSDQATEAEKILKVAAERDPNNAQLRFAIGANYDKMLNDTNATQEAKDAAFENGKLAYKKAIELKPDYFDAAYNLGAMLNNSAAVYITEASNLPLSESEKYDKLMKMATDLLLEAKPYLETCHTLDTNDRNTMIMLRGIYQQTKDLENLKKINAALKGE